MDRPLNLSTQMWGEVLTTSEVDFCASIRNELGSVPWAKPLLSRLPPTVDLSYPDKPLLFELRLASEIHRRGLTADYEYPCGVGDFTVDFRILHNQCEWLIELVTILTSEAVKRATHVDDPFFYTSLSTDAEDPTQSDEGEILLVQQKIGEKVWKNGQPIKFPEPAPNRYHVILVDLRGFGITGGDRWDYREIAYGPAGFTDRVQPLRHYWKMKDGTRVPILGLFDRRNHWQRAAKTIQDRIHFLGFCNDEDYKPGSLAEHTYYLGNPLMFRNDADAQAVAAHYPLRAAPAQPATP